MHGLGRVSWFLARHPDGPLAVPLTSRKQKVQRGMRNVYGIAGREQLPSVQKILATAAVQFALLHFFHRPPLPGFPPPKNPGAHPTMPPLLPYLTELLLAPIAPLGADSSSPPSARPPAASIPSDRTAKLLLSCLTQAGNNGRANPGTRKVRGISTTAASPHFFPVAPPM